MKNQSDKIGIAVVGCGYWGINYLRVFNELAGSEVVAICDQRKERLQEIGQRYPGAVLKTELDEALQIPGVDAIVVGTGATTHFDIAKAALSAGKHVLVEKPMATTVQDCHDLIALAKMYNRTLMVGHTFLYNSGIRKVKENLSRDDMGQIYYLYSTRTNLGPIRYDVNALWDLAPHDVSIFNYLLGRSPEWVSAVGANVLGSENQDVGFVSMGYGKNVIGNIHVSWADPNKVRQLVVVGSNRRIVFDDLNALERVKIYEKGVVRRAPEANTFGEHQFMMRDGDIYSPNVEINEPLKTQCLHFLDCLANDKSPLTDGWAGMEVVKVLTAIDQSIAQNGAPIWLNKTDEQDRASAQDVHQTYVQHSAAAASNGKTLIKG